MKKLRENIAIGAALVLLFAGCTYGLARLGSPEALWLWRDVLGVAL